MTLICMMIMMCGGVRAESADSEKNPEPKPVAEDVPLDVLGELVPNQSASATSILRTAAATDPLDPEYSIAPMFSPARSPVDQLPDTEQPLWRFLESPFDLSYPRPASLEEARDYAWDQAELWVNRIEIGGTVHEGIRSERGLNLTGRFERKFDHISTQFDIGGRYLVADEDVVTNRWSADGTVDFGQVFASDKRWIVFLNADNVYDEVKGIDYRGSFSGGLGYRFFNEREKRLIVRFGPGLTWQKLKDTPSDLPRTELYGEIEFRWPVNTRVAFEQKSRVTPILTEVSHFDSYRVRSEAAFLIDIDERKRWQLKIGTRANFDSTPREDGQFLDYTGYLSIVYTRRGRK